LFFDSATGAFLPGSTVWTGAPAHIHGGTPVPVPMDYDGDGAVDFTVYSGGAWHFYNFNGSYNSRDLDGWSRRRPTCIQKTTAVSYIEGIRLHVRLSDREKLTDFKDSRREKNCKNRKSQEE